MKNWPSRGSKVLGIQQVLPLPATYVLGRDGQVLYAHIEADYSMRAEPSDVLGVLARN